MPNQLRSNEMPELVGRGPFGGIQSEVPLDLIEQYGFADAQNIMFRKASIYTRPRINDLYDFGATPIYGIFDFYTSAGDRVQSLMTKDHMYHWDGGTQTFSALTGTFHGFVNQLFTADCVGGILYFSQGFDKVMSWNGTDDHFNVVTDSVPAKFIFELDFHLLACYTLEPGIAPQRVRWAGAGDGTDWTSFSSGQTDLFNNLGPITGGIKLYQQGYIFQQWGITQIQLTGVGLAPFAFYPLGAKAKGNICPYSLVTFGEDVACYVGKNDIYRFDGSYSIPIGSQPVDGNRRIGARKRIFQDLMACNLETVHGYLSTSDNGNDYGAYWLFMPELKLAWVYHFDENNWTKFTFNNTPSRAGEFTKSNVIRIMDLVGTIAQQLWYPINMTSANPLDSIMIGSVEGLASEMDFTGVSELPSYIRSGQCSFGDDRHEHTVKKFRLVLQDLSPTVYTLAVVSETGASDSKTFQVGTGSGLSFTIVVDFNIAGKYLQWALSAEAGWPMYVSEITPIYDTGGEVRGGNYTITESSPNVIISAPISVPLPPGIYVPPDRPPVILP